MPEPLEVNVYLQNNDQMHMLEALLEGSRRQEAMWRERCKVAEGRLADAQHVNIELVDTLKTYGFRYRQSADMRSWQLPKEGRGTPREGT